MSPTPQLLVYLAGPIDMADEDDRRQWRAQAKRLLQAQGHGTFDPAMPFEFPSSPVRTKEQAERILAINTAAIMLCDGLLAYLGDGRIPTLGTPIEIVEALRLKKKVACFGGPPKSLYVRTWPHHPTLEDAVTALTFVPDEC